MLTLIVRRSLHALAAMQSYIDGLPVFTESPKLYGWTDGECGIMLGVLGLTAPFINQGVAGLARGTSDRILTVRLPVAEGLPVRMDTVLAMCAWQHMGMLASWWVSHGAGHKGCGQEHNMLLQLLVRLSSPGVC